MHCCTWTWTNFVSDHGILSIIKRKKKTFIKPLGDRHVIIQACNKPLISLSSRKQRLDIGGSLMHKCASVVKQTNLYFKLKWNPGVSEGKERQDWRHKEPQNIKNICRPGNKESQRRKLILWCYLFASWHRAAISCKGSSAKSLKWIFWCNCVNLFIYIYDAQIGDWI